VVHLIYRRKHYESQSKDFEFSRLSMQEHWDAGQADMACTLHDPRWLKHERSQTGVHVFDLTSDAPVVKSTAREHVKHAPPDNPTPPTRRQSP
jgi:NTE family protein